LHLPIVRGRYPCIVDRHGRWNHSRADRERKNERNDASDRTFKRSLFAACSLRRNCGNDDEARKRKIDGQFSAEDFEVAELEILGIMQRVETKGTFQFFGGNAERMSQCRR